MPEQREPRADPKAVEPTDSWPAGSWRFDSPRPCHALRPSSLPATSATYPARSGIVGLLCVSGLPAAAARGIGAPPRSATSSERALVRPRGLGRRGRAVRAARHEWRADSGSRRGRAAPPARGRRRRHPPRRARRRWLSSTTGDPVQAGELAVQTQPARPSPAAPRRAARRSPPARRTARGRRVRARARASPSGLRSRRRSHSVRSWSRRSTTVSSSKRASRRASLISISASRPWTSGSSGIELGERPPEADRLAREVSAAAVALVEDQVHDREDRGEAVGKQVSRRHPERDPGLLDLPPGSDEPLGHRLARGRGTLGRSLPWRDRRATAA